MGFWVWKVDFLLRIKSFMWQCLHNRIGVGDCLVKRHLSELDKCPIYLREVETIIHRLRDCEMAKTTWTSLDVRPNNSFFEDSLHIWLEKNCKVDRSKVSNQPPWRILFPFVIWLLWKEMNNVVFKGQNFRPGFHNEVVFQALKFLHCVLNPKISGSRRMIRIRWEKPSPGWVHLNIDGSALGNPSKASCSGIIRNDREDWLGGFSRCIGVTTSFIAKLWALRDGLNLCHNMNLQDVDIQIDAKAAVDVISNPSFSNRIFMPIVDDCRQLIAQPGQVRIGHCYHEANSCANFLARKAALQDCCFSVY